MYSRTISPTNYVLTHNLKYKLFIHSQSHIQIMYSLTISHTNSVLTHNVTYKLFFHSQSHTLGGIVFNACVKYRKEMFTGVGDILLDGQISSGRTDRAQSLSPQNFIFVGDNIAGFILLGNITTRGYNTYTLPVENA